MRVLVSRPEPAASATAAHIRAAGHEAVVAPLFAYAAIDWELPGGTFEAVLLSSAAAVRFAGPKLTALALPVYAVGRATADAARSAGLDVASAGQGSVEALAARLAEQGVVRLLHPCGAHTTDFVPPAGLEVVPCVVYAAQASDWDAAVRAQAATADMALAYSRRGARALAAQLPATVRAQLRLAAISDPVARAAGAGWMDIRIAETPTEQALFAAAGLLCD